MQGQKKIAFLEFSDFSGGVNSVEYPIKIAENQVQPNTSGAILKKSGFIKYPGALGLSAVDTFADHMRMMKLYRQFNTTETLVSLSAGKLYFVNKTTGALTEKYTLGSAANYGESCEAYGKMFVLNGTSNVVKIEGSNVYPVGIAAPSGVSAVASAGAGLPDGAYDVIVGYARRVSSNDVLYSKGQTIGAVTLGGGNNRITVSNFANSSDAQVGNKVLWLKSPGETIHYYFYGTGDNTTTSFIVSSTGSKSVSNVYETYAVDNGLPPAGTYIYSFANRIWIILDNVIYYSAKGYSQYDIEKFPAANAIATPYNLTGIFSVGTNLYFNTTDGIVIMPNADPLSVLYLIEPRWNFFDMHTVDRWNNGVIGLTNDGVKYFDGNKFSSNDLSYDIKNYIDEALKVKTNFRPFGYVYRRSIRNEYHLMWQDENVSSSVNNMHAVLNLDSLTIISAEQFKAAWEFHPYSANYVAISKNDNTVYFGQTHATASKIAVATPSDDLINNIYKPDGSLVAVAEPIALCLKSKIELPEIHAVCTFEKFRVLVKNNNPLSIRFELPDKRADGKGSTDFLDIPAPYGGEAKYDSAKYDESYYPVEDAFVYVGKFPESFKGREIALEINQNRNDPGLSIMAIQIQYAIETGNFI